MLFWIVAAGIGLAVTAPLVRTLLRGRAGGEPAAAYDLRVYRDQLHEVDRDLARGVIGPGDAERLRTEVSRRVLEADRALQAERAGGGAPRRLTMAVAVAVVALMGGAVWAYLRLGAAGYPDMPIAARLAAADDAYNSRPHQTEAEAAVAGQPQAAKATPDASFVALMDKLRAALKDRPDDLKGYQLLASNEAGLGNYVAAAAAQDRVIALKGTGATAEDHAALAELMILAAGGFVTPEAEAELTRTLKIDPLNGTATYYAGLMFAQVGRPDRTFALWAPLLQRSGPADPWVAPIRSQIEGIAAAAGEDRYVLPPDPAAPGPSADDMQAAADMTPEARQEMIRGMVSQLNDRLATEGGPAADWARLIGAYGVLGETDRARAIWTEAQGRFAQSDADLATLRAAARSAGVAE